LGPVGRPRNLEEMKMVRGELSGVWGWGLGQCMGQVRLVVGKGVPTDQD